jgi:anionic cell wall polymer biosynthesis LytR-Cps2A-Psr (LCP) family protein
VTNKHRVVAIATAAVVLLAAGVFVSAQLLISVVNRSIPQADLFGINLVDPTTGSPLPSPNPSPTVPEGSDINGPLNIFIAGEDTRAEAVGWVPHSDADIIMHITADLSHAYITSLPRDLVVSIPSYPASGYGGGTSKLTDAMAFGARQPGNPGVYSTAQGFGLVAQAASNYTGLQFDAGALVSFIGLAKLVDVLDGIDLYVDQYVQSIHMRPEGYEREWCPSCEHLYTGPQATYNVGMQHMIGWQVLDYSRQRYGLPNGAYDRERHQRQIVKAIMQKIITYDPWTHPFVAPWVVSAVGQALTLDLRGRSISAYAYALRNLKPENVTLVSLPGSGVSSGGSYIGEALAPIQAAYFAAARADTLGDFLAANPTLIHDPR